MWRLLLAFLFLSHCAIAADGLKREKLIPDAKRVLFLGDSITASGAYVDDFELHLALAEPARAISVINCGLPSETVSGLSEAGHAGGQFPRPDLHERLDRVLALVKPDVVFACYGMNDGIYLTPDPARLAKYREGIERLRAKVTASGAKIILLTPMLFDPLPLKGKTKPAATVKDGDMYEGYDEVLEQFTAWLLEQRDKAGWEVIDAHGAMKAALADARKKDPAYHFAGDGVHANDAGHHAVSAAIFKYFKVEGNPDGVANAELRKLQKLIHQRGRILADSYLTTAGHKRPGMSKGLPVAEADAKAAELTKEIRETASKVK
jgi:lysophospholipase L1-like esterase